MERQFDSFLISDEKKLLQPERIYEMLHGTYWAKERSRETIARTIENSLCFGVYCGSEQIGFARCATDYAVSFMLAGLVGHAIRRARGVVAGDGREGVGYGREAGREKSGRPFWMRAGVWAWTLAAVLAASVFGDDGAVIEDVHFVRGRFGVVVGLDWPPLLDRPGKGFCRH